MLFTNTMGMPDGLKGQICLDVVRRLREDYLISFNDDGNGDNDGDDDANDGDGNRDDEDGNLDDDGEGDKDPFRSNLSFGFSKMRLDDFGNGNGKSPNNLVVEKESVDPTVERTVIEGTSA
ncbi:hypothetical protein Tco_1226392 [Tanacetum coccineum]